MKLPDGWKEVKLSEFCDIVTGYAFKSLFFNENGKGMPLIRIRDLKEGKTKTYYSGKYQKEYLVIKGDFLIGMDGEFKIREWKSDDSLLNQRVCKLKVNQELALPRYLYYMLSKKLKLIEDKTAFVTVKHISAKQIKLVTLILPPLETQKKIVSILEKAEEAKEWRKEADELTKEFVNSIFSGMFLKGNKFEKVELGNKDIHEEFFAGGDVPKDRLSKERTAEYNIPIFTNGEKNKGFYGYTDKERVIKDSLTISARGTIGYSEIRRGSFFPAIRLIVITPKEKILNLYYLKYAIDNIKFNLGATSIPQLTVPDCKRFKIPLPPIELQNKFASIVKEVEAMKKQQKHSKEQIDNLFNALMQKAFKGELKI